MALSAVACIALFKHKLYKRLRNCLNTPDGTAKEKVEMGLEVLHAVEISADAATIREAITTKKGLSSFWTADSDAEPKEGSMVRAGFPAAPMDCRLKVTHIGDDKVAWTCEEFGPGWAGTTVSWEFGPGTDGATLLMFRHGGWPEDYEVGQFASVNFVWGQVLGKLKAYAESGKPGPLFPAS